MRLLVAQLGMMDYQQALKLQYHLLGLRQRDLVPDTLLLLEHPPVITIGKRGDHKNILLPEQWLIKEGIQLHRIERGGDVTYHGPGQLVGYPIIDLKNYGRRIKRYIHYLEEVFIELLQKEYGIPSRREAAYIGVWADQEKIVAIGVAVKRWVTIHGFAFNVNTNLAHFQGINPCGINKGVTSLAKLLGEPVEMDNVNKQVIRYFSQVFQRQPHLISQQQLVELMGWDNNGQKKTGMA